MGQPRRRMLEVEILEDRCTPSTVAAPLPSDSQLLPNEMPTSQAAILAGPNGGLTLGQSFNFASASGANLAEFPTPGANLILNSGLLNFMSAGTFARGVGPAAFNVNNSAGVESNRLGNLELGPNVLGSLAAAGQLLSDTAGVPSTAPFPLPSYYEGLPMYDAAAAVPVSIQYESFSPFTSNGMGRSSYEGGDGAGMATPTTQPTPPPSAPTSPPLALGWLFRTEMNGAIGDAMHQVWDR